MTNEMMHLQGLLEKRADADVLREMIGFASQRLMELEVGARTGARYGEKSPAGWPSVTVTVSATGRPAPGRWSWRSRSCGKATTSRASWNRRG